MKLSIPTFEKKLFARHANIYCEEQKDIRKSDAALQEAPVKGPYQLSAREVYDLCTLRHRNNTLR